MKIAIDGHFITGNKTGVGYYSYHLLKNLLEIDKKNHYYIIFNSLRMNRPQFDFLEQDNVTILFTPLSNRFPTDIYSTTNYIRYNFFFPLFFAMFNIDIFHGFNCSVPYFSFNTKCVSTFHDMSMITMKKYVKKFEIDRKQIQCLKKWARKSERIISVSYNSEKDILHYIPESVSKITTVQNGHDRQLSDAKEMATVQCPFVLFVGSVDERKNVKACIDTFYILKERAEHKNLKLCIAGNDNTEYADDLKKSIAQRGFSNDIIFSGYVNEHELAWLYSNAETLFFPTFYEGFGFPALEAMKYNCPVVCSNTSSLPEIVADAALTASPDDIETYAQHIHTILSDNTVRKELIAKGVTQPLNFCWNNNAQQVLEIYEQMYNS